MFDVRFLTNTVAADQNSSGSVSAKTQETAAAAAVFPKPDQNGKIKSDYNFFIKNLARWNVYDSKIVVKTRSIKKNYESWHIKNTVLTS